MSENEEDGQLFNSASMRSRQPYKRVDRLADVMRRVLSEALLSKVHHAGLEGVTVTAVRVSADLQHARVYYRVLDPAQKSDVGKALRKVAPLLQREVGDEIQTRYTPRLAFEYDDSLEYSDRIESIFRKIRDESQ